ncbi:hypothetical protein ACTFIZ_001887 [Dictyostelium cf. discoideum]
MKFKEIILDKNHKRTQTVKIIQHYNQQVCHKIPTFILFRAHKDAASQIDKDEIVNFMHSEDNIFYSSNKDQDSQQENDLKRDGYTQESVLVKRGQIENSLLKLHQKSEDAALLMCWVLWLIVDQ